VSRHRFTARGDAGNLVGAVRAIRRMTDDDSIVRDIADDAELIYASHALVATGRMARGVRAVGEGDSILVRVDARDPETGYDYVGVTRKGHRRRVIHARSRRLGPRGRNPASVVATRRARRRGASSMLRTPWGFRWSVRGFHPSSDWAEDALPEVRAAAEHRLDGLAKRIALRWRS
jgi:hypothetical protein